MAKLLQLLEQDCTLTPEQLASMTDMTVEEVKAAIKRYEEDKVILGYQAIVDWDRTQREAVTALIEVKVTPQRGGRLRPGGRAHLPVRRGGERLSDERRL